MGFISTTTRCANCAGLETRLAEALARISELEAVNARLEARLAKLEKNSANSSKPPSSDMVKPPLTTPRRRGRKKKRRIGGQPGHPKHERTAFEPREIDQAWDYYDEHCPDCHGKLKILDKPASIVQQIEIVKRPIRMSEHRSRECYCAHCRKSFTTQLPREIRKSGLVGPRLTTLIGYLKGACHCSFSTIRKYLRDVVGATISRGQLRKVRGKVASSMNDAYDELKEFNGVLGCDYFSAYRKYLRLNEHVLVQFCLARMALSWS